jgi:hypothetical protein
MLKKCLSLTLMMLVCHLGVALVFATLQAEKAAQQAAKVKGEIARRGVGHDARVRIKLHDGSKLKGYIYQAGESDFIIKDEESGGTTTVAYVDVKEVKGKGLSTERMIFHYRNWDMVCRRSDSPRSQTIIFAISSVSDVLMVRESDADGDFLRQRFTRVYVKRECLWRAVATQVTVVKS